MEVVLVYHKDVLVSTTYIVHYRRFHWSKDKSAIAKTTTRNSIVYLLRCCRKVKCFSSFLSIPTRQIAPCSHWQTACHNYRCKDLTKVKSRLFLFLMGRCWFVSSGLSGKKKEVVSSLRDKFAQICDELTPNSLFFFERIKKVVRKSIPSPSLFNPLYRSKSSLKMSAEHDWRKRRRRKSKYFPSRITQIPDLFVSFLTGKQFCQNYLLYSYLFSGKLHEL